MEWQDAGSKKLSGLSAQSWSSSLGPFPTVQFLEFRTGIQPSRIVGFSNEERNGNGPRRKSSSRELLERQVPRLPWLVYSDAHYFESQRRL